jgi:HSP20 family molecular chaperone IbpA
MSGELTPLPSWDKWLDSFRRFEQEIEKLTSDLFKSVGGFDWDGFLNLPEPSIKESPSGLEVHFPIKGAVPGTVDVMVSPTQIGVKGQVSQREEAKDGRSLTVSRESFYRVVPLPAPVDPNTAETQVLRDGIVVKATKAK